MTAQFFLDHRASCYCMSLFFRILPQTWKHCFFSTSFFNYLLQEITPDTSTMSPDEAVFRQLMIKDVYTLLHGLEPREREVLILRFGLGNHQYKSLEEIGRRFCVSKEWIRKIERTALTKLRNEESVRILSHYVYMQ